MRARSQGLAMRNKGVRILHSSSCSILSKHRLVSGSPVIGSGCLVIVGSIDFCVLY